MNGYSAIVCKSVSTRLEKRVLALIIATPLGLQAQGAQLSGVVIGAPGNGPVSNAEVVVREGGIRAYSDSTGRFRIVGVPRGSYWVVARKLGFGADSARVMIKGETESTLNFVLQTQPAVLDTITSRATAAYRSPQLRGFEERRRTGQGYFVAEAELRKFDHTSLPAVLSKLPGLRLVGYRGASYAQSSRNAGGGGFAILGPSKSSPRPGCDGSRADPCDLNSPRGCWVAVYLDGIPIFTGPPGNAPDFARMQVNEYAGVEYYSGGARIPVQFASGKSSDCGVLLLWTRER
jgi:hypothetical protein